jgi:acyl carrier protein
MVEMNDFKAFLIKSLRLEDVEPSEIDDNDALFGDEGLGLDSVDSIELVLAIDKEYGVKISDPKLYDTIFVSVASLLGYINEQKK